VNQAVSVLMGYMKISMADVFQLRSVHVNMVVLLMEKVNRSKLNVRPGKITQFSITEPLFH